MLLILVLVMTLVTSGDLYLATLRALSGISVAGVTTVTSVVMT